MDTLKGGAVMAKQKDIAFEPSEELETELNRPENKKKPLVDTKLHHNVALSKGERHKAPTPRKGK
jgi:hypothetical protein